MTKGRSQERGCAKLKELRTVAEAPDFNAVGGAEIVRMSEEGVRRDKAALSSGCKAHPAIRSRRKQSEQS